MATRYIFEIEDMPTTSIFKIDPSLKLEILNLDPNDKNILISLSKSGNTTTYRLPIGSDYVAEWYETPKVEVLPPNE